MGQLVQEPAVDVRERMDPVHGIARLEGRGDGEDARVRGMRQREIQVLRHVRLVAHEAVRALADHPDALLDGLLEGPADGHHLADALHAGADVPGDALELRQVPARDLHDDIVQGRFEEGRRRPGDRVLELVQAVAQAQLRRHGRQRIARRLGGQGRGTAEPRIDLDHPVILPVGAEGVLDVAFSDDPEMPDNVDGGLPQEMVFVVGEGLRRGDDDAFAGMDPERVHVLHVADRDAVVEAVADHLVFDFLPPTQGFLHKDLRREGKGLGGDGVQLGLVLAEAGTEAAQGVGRPDDDGIAHLAGGGSGLLEGRRRMGADGLHANFVEPGHKEFPVLRVDDGFHGGSQHLDAVTLQDAAAEQGHAAVERGLAAEGKEDAVRTLFLDDFFHEGRRHRQEIHLVGHAFRGLDRRDIGVHEDGPDAFLAQGLEGLRTAVVEFSGLADLQRARAQDKHFADHSRDRK